MGKINLGLIGAGSLANSVHYPSLAEFDDVNLVALCDLIEEKVQATAEKFKIEKMFTDYKEMIEKVDIDAVYILMPPHHLYDLVIYCLERKLNVFIEKPPGVSTFQTRSMARLAEKNGCKTMVAFNRRYIPLMKQVKEVIEERGPIIQCQATFFKNQVGGGIYFGGAVDILTSDAVHAVDTLRWMGGEVKKVASHVGRYYAEVENSFNAVMEFENGATGILTTNWAVGKRVHTFEMHARSISAFINPDDRAIIYQDNKEEARMIKTTEAAGSDKSYKYYGFYDENRHFIDCLKGNKNPQTSFSDAMKTMELVEMIYQNRI